MALILRFLSTGTIPGSGELVRMRGASITIGRGEDSDLALPDPDRVISKNHCVIENHNGNYLAVDLSSNGTFLNYGKIPFGKTPTSLNDGDVLSLGTYELMVEISLVEEKEIIPADHDAIAPEPTFGGDFLEEETAGGDFLDDLLGSDPPTGPKSLKSNDPADDFLPPLGEGGDPMFGTPAVTGRGKVSQHNHGPAVSDAFVPAGTSGGLIPDDWDDDLLGGGGDAHDPFSRPAPTSRPTIIPEETQTSPSPRDIAATVTTGDGTNAAAREFLKAVGADDFGVKDEDLQETMRRLGGMLKMMITGIREILMTRTSIKSEFRIDQTTISVGDNNPLKFSISAEQAIEAMVLTTKKGYLAPEIAAIQALNDIKAHEIAMVTGMEAALKGVLRRLNPEVVEQAIVETGMLGRILTGKKARYWELYEKMYAEISDQAANDFHELFSKEFARAYKTQLDKLK